MVFGICTAGINARVIGAPPVWLSLMDLKPKLSDFPIPISIMFWSSKVNQNSIIQHFWLTDVVVIFIRRQQSEKESPPARRSWTLFWLNPLGGRGLEKLAVWVIPEVVNQQSSRRSTRRRPPLTCGNTQRTARAAAPPLGRASPHPWGQMVGRQCICNATY